MFDQSQIQEFKEVGQLPLGLWEVTGMHGKPLDVGSALSPWGVVMSFLEVARLQLSPHRDVMSCPQAAPPPLFLSLCCVTSSKPFLSLRLSFTLCKVGLRGA